MVASRPRAPLEIDGRNAAQRSANATPAPGATSFVVSHMSLAAQPSAVLGRVKRWVLAVLAMLARKGGLRVAPCGCAPAAKRRRF